MKSARAQLAGSLEAKLLSPESIESSARLRSTLAIGCRRIFSFLRATAHPGQVASRWACFLAATGIVLLIFGDVVFLRTSLGPLDYCEVISNPSEHASPRSMSPERPGRNILDGQGDIGAAAYQFQPAQKFMAYCLRNGESPFWDPYAAAGALGPETLTDLKFSPVTLVAALLGGSSRAFSFVLLALYVLSAYCLLRACTVHLGLSFQAALVSSFIFFLNGFTLGNLYTQIAQPYFLAPPLLLSILALMDQINPIRVAFVLIAHISFVATTFFPTAVLSGMLVYGISLSLCLSQTPRNWRRILFVHLGTPAAAIAVLSFVYFPTF